MDSKARSVGQQVPEGDGNIPACQHRHDNDNSPARQHRHENNTSDCSAGTATTYTPSSRERDCTKHVSFCIPKPVDNTAVWPAAVETERANSSNKWNEYVGRQRQAVSHNPMYYYTDHGVPLQFRSQQHFNHAYETPMQAHESHRGRPWRDYRGRPPKRGRYGGRWQFRGGRFANNMRTCGRYCCGIPFAYTADGRTDVPVQSATSDTVQPAVGHCADVTAEQTPALPTNYSPETSVKGPGGVDVESQVDTVYTAPVPMGNKCSVSVGNKNVSGH